jgi:cytochrome P450
MNNEIPDPVEQQKIAFWDYDRTSSGGISDWVNALRATGTSENPCVAAELPINPELGDLPPIAVFGFEEAKEVLVDDDRFVSSKLPHLFSTFPLSETMVAILASTILATDGEGHSEAKTMIRNNGFDRERMTEAVPINEGYIQDFVDLLGDEEADPKEITESLEKVVVSQILGVLDIPDSHTDSVLRLSKKAFSFDGDEEGISAGFGLLGIVEDTFDNSTLAQNLLSDGMDIEKVKMNMIMLLAGGITTTTSVIAGAIKEFSNLDRDAKDEIIHDKSVMSRFISEVTRLTSPLYSTARIATVDTEVGGIDVKEGQRVIVLLSEANRDPVKFGFNADEVNLENTETGIPFGAGPHSCIGSALARELTERVLRKTDETLDSPVFVASERRRAADAVVGIAIKYDVKPETDGSYNEKKALMM